MPSTSQQIVGLLIDALQTEARKILPDYVKDSWLNALSDVIEKGLYHAWVGIIDGHVVRIEANTVEVVDERD
tara:strand:- start:1358 stop:1573 length:216 start_codon:yes stop_codon:yes gene_type:complete